jgi:hypothetical protein
MGALATAAGLRTGGFAGGLLVLTGARTTAWVTASMTRCVGASQRGPREKPLVDWRDFVACTSLTNFGSRIQLGLLSMLRWVWAPGTATIRGRPVMIMALPRSLERKLAMSPER